jgi:hypothetical protein
MRERGEGKLQLILALAGTFVLIVGGWQVVPWYVKGYSFREAIRSQVKFARVERKTNDQVQTELFRRAQELKIPLERKAIRVSVQPRNVRINAQYTVTMNLFIMEYEKTWVFSEDTTTAF